MNMRWLISIFMVVLPVLAQTQTITLAVPSAVAGQIDVYRAQCSNDGGELELDGDEVFKVWTDEGEEAYVIYAAFTCGSLGHLWCGAKGHCSTQLVIDNRLYETNRILSAAPNRISKTKDGGITYWLPDGFKLKIGD
jgi:hypothetical protein